jgi:chemotaxis protein methyltransferase CheR
LGDGREERSDRVTPTPRDVAAFRSVIAHQLGLAFDDGRVETLASFLGRRARTLGIPVTSYVERLEDGGDFTVKEVDAAARELTVGETYFFRDADQLRVFREVVIPELSRRGAPMRILSAGCASGEEAYTLAMILRQYAIAEGSIFAVDVNPLSIEKARRMHYSPWSLREVPAHVIDRWFRRDGGEFVLQPDLGRSVHFEQHNLADTTGSWLQPAAFDVVFCRNVLMYFTPETARRVIDRLGRALVPSGFLFVGPAESLRGISDDFHVRHTHGTFYYQRREHTALSTEDRATRRSSTGPAPMGSWVDIIRDATERVRAMSEGGSAFPPPRAAQPDLAPAFELFERECFGDAIALLDTMPPATATSPDALLLRAALQTHTSDLAGAERTCAELLRHDTTNADAHYVIALCREAGGDLVTAKEHDRLAASLDPSFAMPFMHTGLLAKRSGDLELARSALGRAIALLERETTSRLVLFGGGFRRDALIALCRSHLAGEMSR